MLRVDDEPKNMIIVRREKCENYHLVQVTLFLVV